MSTSNAIINWSGNDKVRHLRLYTVYGGKITEQCYDGGGWTQGGFSAPGTSVDALSWLDPNGGVHIRLYVSCVYGKTISEYCYDGSGWSQGGFSTPGQSVTPTIWVDGGQPHMRLYVRNAGTITEWCYEGGWSKGGYPSTPTQQF